MNENPSGPSPISLIADFDGDISNLFDIKLNDTLPILPLRNMLLFPGIVIPVAIERPFSTEVIKRAKETDSYIGVVGQKSTNVEVPGQKDLYSIGTVAKVVRILELPGAKLTVLLQGFCRFKILELLTTTPCYTAKVEQLKEGIVDESNKEMVALTDACKDLMGRLIKLNEGGAGDASFAIRNIRNRTFLINFIAANLSISLKEKMELLQLQSMKDRAYKLLNFLNREVQYASLKANIQERTREDLDQQQKEYFLQQQIKNMQDELGESGTDGDIYEMQQEAQKKKLPDDVRKTFDKELKKLERINTQSPDYNVQLN